MKLYLDDTRDPPKGWTRAQTLDEAKRLLSRGQVAELSLDYDLTPGRAPGDDTGLDLLTWMRETGHWPRYRPKVHSGNVDGAKSMKAYIEAHAGRGAAPRAARAGHSKPLSKGGSTRYAKAEKSGLYMLLPMIDPSMTDLGMLLVLVVALVLLPYVSPRARSWVTVLVLLLLVGVLARSLTWRVW